MSQAAPRKKKPFLPPAFVQAMLAGHSALGLAFAALIYVVCISGTVAVFLHDLHRWEMPNAPLVGTVTPETMNAAVNNLYAKALEADAVHDMYLYGPSPLTPWFGGSYFDHDTDRRGAFLFDASGAIAVDPETPVTDFLVELHVNLHLPPTIGLFIVGLTGVALLSSLISGILSHPRVFKDAFALRWGGSRRLQEADLHNRLSVWGLPFHVVVSLSGALLGLSTLVIGLLAMAAYDGDTEKAFAAILGPMPTENEAAAPMPDIVAMMADIHTRAPEAELDSVLIQHAATEGQMTGIQAASPGHLALGERYFYDAKGQFIADSGQEGGTVGQQILGALQPLHFGWFGGIWIKIAYGLLGLALTVITTSGVMIWLARRRDKGRPAPAWERVWAATVWSQPVSYALVGIAGLAAGEAALMPAFLGGIVLSALVAILVRDGAAVSRTLRWMSVAALGGLAATHVAVNGGAIADAMAWAVDGVLVAAALIIMLPLVRTGGAPQPALKASPAE